jgi:hypothetical protein
MLLPQGIPARGSIFLRGVRRIWLATNWVEESMFAMFSGSSMSRLKAGYERLLLILER